MSIRYVPSVIDTLHNKAGSEATVYRKTFRLHGRV